VLLLRRHVLLSTALQLTELGRTWFKYLLAFVGGKGLTVKIAMVVEHIER